jgi:ribosomal protein S18 acetylase RimI-like enzyme
MRWQDVISEEIVQDDYDMAFKQTSSDTFCVIVKQDDETVGYLELVIYSPSDLRIEENSEDGKIVRSHLSVSQAKMYKEHRGKGLGLKMYQYGLAHLPAPYTGIYSFLKFRSNTEQVPAIYAKLGGYTTDSGALAVIDVRTPRQVDQAA